MLYETWKRLRFCSKAFLTLSQLVRLFVRTRLATLSNAFGFSFERVWLVVQTYFIQQLNASRLSIEHVDLRSEHVWTKNALYLVSDRYSSFIIWIYAVYSNIVVEYIYLTISQIRCSNIKFHCEKWVRFPACPLYEAIFCNVNQLGAHGLSAVQNQEASTRGRVVYH